MLGGGEVVRPQSGKGAGSLMNSHETRRSLQQIAERDRVRPLPRPPLMTPSGGPGIPPIVSRSPPATPHS